MHACMRAATYMHVSMYYTHVYIHKCSSRAEYTNLLTDWLGLLEGKNMIAKAAACSLEASGLKFQHKIFPHLHQKGWETYVHLSLKSYWGRCQRWAWRVFSITCSASSSPNTYSNPKNKLHHMEASSSIFFGGGVQIHCSLDGFACIDWLLLRLHLDKCLEQGPGSLGFQSLQNWCKKLRRIASNLRSWWLHLQTSWCTSRQVFLNFSRHGLCAWITCQGHESLWLRRRHMSFALSKVRPVRKLNLSHGSFMNDLNISKLLVV